MVWKISIHYNDIVSCSMLHSMDVRSSWKPKCLWTRITRKALEYSWMGEKLLSTRKANTGPLKVTVTNWELFSLSIQSTGWQGQGSWLPIPHSRVNLRGRSRASTMAQLPPMMPASQEYWFLFQSLPFRSSSPLTHWENTSRWSGYLGPGSRVGNQVPSCWLGLAQPQLWWPPGEWTRRWNLSFILSATVLRMNKSLLKNLTYFSLAKK